VPEFTLRKDGMPWGGYEAKTLKDAVDAFKNDEFFKRKQIALLFITDIAVFESKNGHKYHIANESDQK
jgi:hypothetical protein